MHIIILITRIIIIEELEISIQIKYFLLLNSFKNFISILSFIISLHEMALCLSYAYIQLFVMVFSSRSLHKLKLYDDHFSHLISCETIRNLGRIYKRQWIFSCLFHCHICTNLLEYITRESRCIGIFSSPRYSILQFG